MSSNDKVEVIILWEARRILDNSGLALTCGISAAAAASIAGAVVMMVVMTVDIEAGLDGTRHGRTLTELFATHIMMRSQPEGIGRGKGLPVALTIMVQSREDGDVLDAKEMCVLTCLLARRGHFQD
jgi:hypothetical protein